MVVVLHLPSNFYVFIYHEILSYSFCPWPCVCTGLGNNHKTLYCRIQGIMVKRSGGRERGRREKGKRKREREATEVEGKGASP